MNNRPASAPHLASETRSAPGFLPPRWMRWIARLLILTLSTQPVLSFAQTSSAQTVQASAPLGGTLKHTGNNVPVIDIAAPNRAGVSHNQYQTYNVGREGLILNNIADRAAPTQLGGWVGANPKLAGNAARLILNEVIGPQRSLLLGPTEIAGQAAHLILANPNGITCNGCGFLNTPRATLAAGRAVLDDGALTHYDIRTGELFIEGDGLEASAIDRLELLARDVFDVLTHKASAQLTYTGCGDCGGSKEDAYFTLTEIDRTEVINASAPSQLLAGGNMLLVAETIANPYSHIVVGGDLQVDADTFTTRGIVTGDIQTQRALGSYRLKKSPYRNMHWWADQINQRYSNPGIHDDAALQGDLSAFLSNYIGSQQPIGEPTFTPAADNGSYDSLVMVGGNVAIQASLIDQDS
ncbi:MAG: filamentous hemagglutinin N-terminal domain-containing protein, partial [Azoarcus sp.]|nr:filamentous hemagglutinin N-terminal domain-containing protein [Azoarcus sp.]